MKHTGRPAHSPVDPGSIRNEEADVMMSLAQGLRNETGPGDLALRPPDRSDILTVNGGSSSLKFALFERTDPPARRASGRIERIGLPDPRLAVTGVGGLRHEAGVEAPDPQAAVGLLVEWLGREVGLLALAAVGHRVVHGGGRYHRPVPFTDELIAEPRRIGPYDPEHLPGELELIEPLRRLDRALPQVAWFDTAFHHDLPRVAGLRNEAGVAVIPADGGSVTVRVLRTDEEVMIARATAGVLGGAPPVPPWGSPACLESRRRDRPCRAGKVALFRWQPR
jgi:acetate kinase